MLGLYLYQDDLLASKGERRTSPWWKWTFAQFFDARLDFPWLFWILVMVGRGGGKSSTLERLAIIVMIFAVREAPPSETWQAIFMSILKEDARKRIIEIEKLLHAAYGLPDVTVALGSMSIALKDSEGNAIEIISVANTIAGASGPSTAFAAVDEAAKMSPTGASPDRELVVSLAETTRARSAFVGIRSSSAWLTRGAHYGAVDQGSNSANFVATIGAPFIDDALAGYEDVARWSAAQGHREDAAQIRAWAKMLHAGSHFIPTWTANPTISALASRQILETLPRAPGDEDIPITTYWLRESGSMSLTGDGGPDFAAQCLLAASITQRVNALRNGRRVPTEIGLMPVPGAAPGDPRHAGSVGGRRLMPGGMAKRRVF